MLTGRHLFVLLPREPSDAGLNLRSESDAKTDHAIVIDFEVGDVYRFPIQAFRKVACTIVKKKSQQRALQPHKERETSRTRIRSDVAHQYRKFLLILVRKLQ